MNKNPIVTSMREANTLKEKGDVFLKQALTQQDSEEKNKLFVKALSEYHKANLYLRSIDVSEDKREGMDDLVNGFLEQRVKKTEEDVKNIQSLKSKIFNNMSLIYLKQKKIEKVAEYCEKILKIDESNVKALQKMVMINIEQDNYERAEGYIKNLIKTKEVDQSTISSLRDKISSKRKKTDKKLMQGLKNYNLN